MEDGWERVRKEATCSVCFTVFKEPKMLPCLHTFCLECLKMLWQRGTKAPRGYKAGNNKTINCPECREKVTLSSLAELPSSFSITRLVDIVKMQDRLIKEAPPSCQSCSSKTRAVATCAPCGIFLCAPCLDVHKTLKLTSSHQINSLDDIKSGKVTVPSILDHKKEMCSVHPDKPLELYCKTDKCLICLGCAVVTHRNHQYDFVDQIAKQHKSEIQKTLPDLKLQLERIQETTDKVKDMEKQIQLRKEKNTNYVNKVFQEIQASLRERKKQILEDINITTATRIKALNEQQNELINLRAQVDGYLELIEIKLKSERDRDIVAMKDQMISRGNSLSYAVKSTRSSPIETVPPKVEFPRLQNFLDLARVLGVSFSSETCHLVKLTTQNPNTSTFKVTVKDSLGQPISNCESLLDIKIISNKFKYGFSKYIQDIGIETPVIINNGNGNYQFSTTYYNIVLDLDTKAPKNRRYGDPYNEGSYYAGDLYYGGYKDKFRGQITQENYGLVCVRLFGKDVPESPLR